MAPTIQLPRRKRSSPTPAPSKHVEQLEFVCDYDFTDPTGCVLFQKKRYAVLNPLPGGRTKTFRYLQPDVWDPKQRYRKPEGADGIVYNLPAVLRAVLDGAPIHWTEGEKDADALIERGYVATSVHQGANKVTLAQAAWLRGAGEVYIWVDKDVELPAIGAHDAAMRHDLLRKSGMSGSVEFLRARGPWGGLKDAYDHLAAGHTVEQAVHVNPERLAVCAARFTPRKNWRGGYDR